MPCFDGNHGAVELLRENRAYMDAGRTGIPHFKVLAGYDDQFYIAVQTAVEGKISLLRIHAVVFTIVNGNNQQVALL